MHDYMICIDENGSPYLAHALFGNRKGGQKKDHDYIERIIGKNGKWRYFYTQEQVKAYGNKAKKAGNNIIKTTKKIIKNPSKAGSIIDREVNKLDLKMRSGLGATGGINRAVTSARSAVKATRRVVSEMARDAIKPLDRKKKNTLNKIHEKFKDVALDTVSLFVNENTRGILNGRKNKNTKEGIALTLGLMVTPPGAIASLGATALEQAVYSDSIFGKVERWLDSPVAELHNKKYKQYTWKAMTTDFGKPKEIASNAKKAWGERVKRDQARAKSMQRRGVSPQRMLR